MALTTGTLLTFLPCKDIRASTAPGMTHGGDQEDGKAFIGCPDRDASDSGQSRIMNIISHL